LLRTRPAWTPAEGGMVKISGRFTHSFLAGPATLAVLAGALAGAPQARGQGSAAAGQDCTSAGLAAEVSVDGKMVRVTTADPRGAADSGGASTRDVTRAYAAFLRDGRNGSPAAQVNLAVAYLAGWGTKVNAGAALYWLNRASESGYPLAFYDLGILYFRGCGVRRDLKEAFRQFERGAKAGDARSQVNLAYFYENGLGTPRDVAAAVSWYRKAAESGDATAQYNFAETLLHGEGLARDDAGALGWYRRAALQGHTGAQIMLGSMFAAGRGATRDLAAGYSWILAASLQGDRRADKLLPSLARQLGPVELAEAQSRARALAAGAQERELAQNGLGARPH